MFWSITMLVNFSLILCLNVLLFEFVTAKLGLNILTLTLAKDYSWLNFLMIL